MDNVEKSNMSRKPLQKLSDNLIHERHNAIKVYADDPSDRLHHLGKNINQTSQSKKKKVDFQSLKGSSRPESELKENIRSAISAAESGNAIESKYVIALEDIKQKDKLIETLKIENELLRMKINSCDIGIESHRLQAPTLLPNTETTFTFDNRDVLSSQSDNTNDDKIRTDKHASTTEEVTTVNIADAVENVIWDGNTFPGLSTRSHTMNLESSEIWDVTKIGAEERMSIDHWVTTENKIIDLWSSRDSADMLTFDKLKPEDSHNDKNSEHGSMNHDKFVSIQTDQEIQESSHVVTLNSPNLQVTKDNNYPDISSTITALDENLQNRSPDYISNENPSKLMHFTSQASVEVRSNPITRNPNDNLPNLASLLLPDKLSVPIEISTTHQISETNIYSPNSAFSKVKPKADATLKERIKDAKESSVKVLFRKQILPASFTPIQVKLKEYRKTEIDESGNMVDVHGPVDSDKSCFIVPLTSLPLIQSKLQDWKESYGRKPSP